MKVKFSIKKEKETIKTGTFSKKDIDKYELTTTFSPSEKEKKIFNEHPLFQDMVFMEYNELDKFATGFLNLGKELTVDKTKVIFVKDIYNSPSYKFRAYSVNRIYELRGFVLEAGKNFANVIKFLEELEGTNEIEFKPEE